MFTRLALLGFIFSVFTAHAQQSISTVDVFNWRVSGSFELKVRFNGVPVAFKGDLRENGDSAEVTKDSYAAHLNSYPGFVAVIISQPGREDIPGQLYLLERKNKDFEQMNENAILGRAPEMAQDLQYSLERYARLQKLNGNDPSFCFRTMVSYFEAFPNKKLDSFADDAEKGVDFIKLVQKPTSRVASNPNTPSLPPRPGLPGQVAGEDSTQTSPSPAPRPRRPRVAPQPADPRYVPQQPQGGYDPFYRGPVQGRRPQYGEPVPPGAIPGAEAPEWAYQQQRENTRRRQRVQPRQRDYDPYQAQNPYYPQQPRPAPSPFNLFNMFQ